MQRQRMATPLRIRVTPSGSSPVRVSRGTAKAGCVRLAGPASFRPEGRGRPGTHRSLTFGSIFFGMLLTLLDSNRSGIKPGAPQFGYPMALALMLVMGVGLYLAFKRRGWL